ncbi:hypothetical protein ABZ894_04000 [Nocardia beijingensis]|uniref:tetratricopeptide repeat protein n=1 Tax=Nocardia beijingensis TaxID=95162 RepID=UPI0033C8AE2B
MNERYSSWAARNTPEELPLAARYQSADPIRWHGSMVYPMYTEQVGPAPTTVTLTMISAAPPAGLRGLGMGLSVVDGYLDLHGRSLAGVDAWSDALAAGVSFDVTPTAPVTLVTLTPVWVDEFGTQKSWAGNYGIVVEHRPNGRVVLWCSIGEGPPNFANLVVELSTAPTPVAPQPSVTAPSGTNPSIPHAVSSAGPPTLPTMPVPRIDAASLPRARAERPAADPSAAGGGGPGKTPPHAPPRRAGSLFVNLQSSRAARSTPETPHAARSSRTRDSAHPAPAEEFATSAAHSGPHSLAGDIPSEAHGVLPSSGSQPRTEVSAQHADPRPRMAPERTAADSYGTFGPPVAHTHPPEDPARSGTAPLGSMPPASGAPVNGPNTASSPIVANPWTADPYRALDPSGTHAQPQAEPPLPGSGPASAGPRATRTPPGPAATPPAADTRRSVPSTQVANSPTAAEPYRAFDAGTPARPVAQTPPADSGAAPAEPADAPSASNLSTGAQVSQAPPAAQEPVREFDAAVTTGSPTASAPSNRAPDIAPAAEGIPRPAASTSTGEPKPSGDPGYRGALYELGVAMYRRGEEEQACGLWTQASDAGHAGAAYELGMVRLRRGDPVGAESWWRTAADRREPRAIAELADLLDQLGKHAEAKSWRVYAAEQQDRGVVSQSAR